jgi:Predicted nucleotide-binding protein containing TIR-like domain
VNQSADPKKVLVVYGRNEDARRAMFSFLRAIGLEPLEWTQAVSLTADGSPYVGQILDRAFTAAQAVVVLVTGDDLARLETRYLQESDPPYERALTPQARP